MQACKGDKEKARVHLELVISGKPLEVNATARKGKYSMEVCTLSFSDILNGLLTFFLQNALHVRTNAALEALDSNSKL